MNKDGYFKLIIGPMYAGKSTELLRNIDQFKFLNKNILVVNHKLNNRYNSNNLTTHNGNVHNDCIVIERLEELTNKYSNEFYNADIIIIDELQFFDDALTYIPFWCDSKKKYIVASGLNGNSDRKPIGQVLDLIPHANEIISLRALCCKCCDGTLGSFSKKIINNNNNILVGSTETYIAVCRKHYLND